MLLTELRDEIEAGDDGPWLLSDLDEVGRKEIH